MDYTDLKVYIYAGNIKGGSITVPLTSCLNGLESAVCQLTIFFSQNRLIQTSQTGGQWYNDISPFSIPCIHMCVCAHKHTHTHTHPLTYIYVYMFVCVSASQFSFKCTTLSLIYFSETNSRCKML